jgi:hypothetical protein
MRDDSIDNSRCGGIGVLRAKGEEGIPDGVCVVRVFGGFVTYCID